MAGHSGGTIRSYIRFLPMCIVLVMAGEKKAVHYKKNVIITID